MHPTRPLMRPLRVYAFDPSRTLDVGNETWVAVPHEDLQPGPVGAKVAVLDYDAGQKCFYEAVDLDHPEVLLAQGLAPSEADPRFHQQMVYAVASKTIHQFEFALGRPIRWRHRKGAAKDDPLRRVLIILPHAFPEANAYYDPERRALLFGYFKASAEDVGTNLPGQTVFTCLSHDVVVHETTHAVVDAVRRHFTDVTGPDAPAFHEAFADIVALLQHFMLREPLVDVIRRTGGLIHRPRLRADAPAGAVPLVAELDPGNPLVDLARQFGEAIGTRAALRSAIGSTPDPRALAHTLEPHHRGAILVAAVFDACFSVYVRRTRDLLALGQAGGAIRPDGDVHPDLANRLAGQAIKTARDFLSICIRALDYLPPVDVEFGEFLRAMVTADRDLVPYDPLGYRASLIAAFRRRGIVPAQVSSYSEDALCWEPPEPLGPRKRTLRFRGDLGFGRFPTTWEPPESEYDDADDGVDPEAAPADATLARLAQQLHAFAEGNRAALALDPDLPIQVGTFHPVYRIPPEGGVRIQFMVEFLQKRDEPFHPQGGAMFTFRGGSTVIFNRHGEVIYIVRKPLSTRRARRQRDYLRDANGASPYRATPSGEALDFRRLHGAM